MKRLRPADPSPTERAAARPRLRAVVAATLAAGLCGLVDGAVPVDAEAPTGGLAQDGLKISATATPTVLQSLGNRSFSLMIRVQNSAPAQRVELSVGGGRWPGETGAVGAPLLVGSPVTQGPGVVREMPIAQPALSPGACVRGADGYGVYFSVAMPAETTTVVTLPVTAEVPPWPGTDYTPRVDVAGVGGQPESPAIKIPVPAIQMTGPTGFLIDLAVGQTGSPITAGSPQTIVGNTDPPIRGRIVRVTVSRLERGRGESAPGSTQLLALERTDRRGRFRVRRWRPRVAGAYEVSASIAQPGPGLLHDRTCPAKVTVSSAH